MKFNFDQLVSIIFTIGLCNVAVILARIMKCMITTPVVDGLSFYFFSLRNSMGSCFCSSHVKRIRPASGFCWFKQCLGSNKGWPGDT